MASSQYVDPDTSIYRPLNLLTEASVPGNLILVTNYSVRRLIRDVDGVLREWTSAYSQIARWAARLIRRDRVDVEACDALAAATRRLSIGFDFVCGCQPRLLGLELMGPELHLLESYIRHLADGYYIVTCPVPLPGWCSHVVDRMRGELT